MSPQKAFAHFFYVTLMALGQSEELVSRGAYPRHYQTRTDVGSIKPVHICQVVFGGFNFFPLPRLTAILRTEHLKFQVGHPLTPLSYTLWTDS